ncbi:MAG: aldehyde ferredoxin oxidoreductase family protein [Promethearchaeota archaeon]
MSEMNEMNKMNKYQVTCNLSTENVEKIPISDKVLKQYLGGRGLATKLFVDHLSPHPNLYPLSEKNELIFAVGPLTGTLVPTSGRLALVTKSPLTNTIFYSNTGGYIAPHLKKSGCEALIVRGKAPSPKYLVINSSEDIEIKDAQDLWGLDTRAAHQKLQELEGDKIHTLLIGPAGENLVSFASIMNDGDQRAFGRGGVGAVMGSKNLKAIVFKTHSGQPPVANQDLLRKLVKPALDKIKLVPITRAALPMFGTSSLVNLINEIGMLPINNFQKGYSSEAKQVSGESIRKEIFEKSEGCWNCPIRCGRMTKVGDFHGKGPEYESVVLLGPTTGIFDLVTVTKANYMCNLLGLDTISTGATIACAMELSEAGFLSDAEIRFGNAQILIPLIKKIAIKEGIGAELAEGSRKFAAKYNHPECAMQVKGLELPAYDPRGAFGHALGYATSNRGGCHLTGYLAAMEIFAAPKKIPRHTTAGKSDLLVLKQHQSAIEDSLVVCAFAGWAIDMEFYVRFLYAVTGIEYDVTELMKIGERIYNLERMYSIREGLDPSEDTLPSRFLQQDLDGDMRKNPKVPLQQMLKDYYFVRKWNNRGFALKSKRDELDLTLLEGLTDDN